MGADGGDEDPRPSVGGLLWVERFMLFMLVLGRVIVPVGAEAARESARSTRST
jgi:hypothetical protein